jgi:hypothetical protein
LDQPLSVPDLDPLRADIKRMAEERGLVVVPETPDTSGMAPVQYSGDWPAYVELAARAGAVLLYVAAPQHDPERWAGFVAGQSPAPHDPDVPHDPEAWLHQRLREAAAPWDDYTGRVGWISCVWCREGVAHHWDIGTDWHDACELAYHPRFPEATNDAKRVFMAEQLFSNAIDELQEASGHSYTYQLGRINAQAVAERATLIYWWEVEPTERASKAERARDLRRQGESIRNIAAVLKMPEGRVRAVLEQEK